MTPIDTNLKGALGEAIADTKDTAKSETTKQAEGISESQSGDTKTGETPEYVAGIDISDIPAQDRPRFKEKLEKKLGLLDKGYQDKYKEIATFKKAQDELVSAGLNAEEARDVLLKHIESKKNPQDKSQVKKTLDNLIDNAPNDDQKESLRQLQTIIMEVTDSEKLQKRVDQLEKTLGNVAVGYQDVRRKEVESELKPLSERYSKDLVNKYHDVIVDDCMKFNVTPSQALRNRATDDEIEQVFLSKNKRKEEKLNAVSSPSSGMTSAEKIETKNRKVGDILRDVIKLTKG